MIIFSIFVCLVVIFYILLPQINVKFQSSQWYNICLKLQKTSGHLMELIEVINSSLIIFFSFVSVTATFSYISYKLKDRSNLREKTAQTESVPATGIYPRMMSVNTTYKIPGQTQEHIMPRRINLFRRYSFNLNEKLHKVNLTAN